MIAFLVLASGAAHSENLDSFRPRYVWSAFGPTIGYSGFEIGDVDGDGSLDLVAVAGAVPGDYYGSSYWYQASLTNGELVQRWTSLPYPASIQRLALAGTASRRFVVLATRYRVLVFDGATKDLVSSFAAGDGDVTDLAVGDLDGKDGLEAVVCSHEDLFVHDLLSGDLLAPRFGFGCTDLDLGDTDGDGFPELALAGNPFGGFVLDGASLDVEWADLDGFGSFVKLVDTDHDGTDDIVSSQDSSNIVRTTAAGALEPHWTRALDWTSQVDAVDVDGDGFEEILITNPYDGAQVVEELSGADKWSPSLQGGASGPAAAGDLDQDGVVELLVVSGDSHYYRHAIEAVDCVSHLVEARSFDLRGPFHDLDAVDVDGDGALEIVTAAASSDGADGGARFLRFDWNGRNLAEVGPANFSTSGEKRSVATVAAQLDDDPSLELCAALEGYYSDRRLLCVDGVTSDTEWEIGTEDAPQFSSLMAAQLDIDPGMELVAGSPEPAAFAFQGDTGWMKWSTPGLNSLYSNFGTLRLGDVVALASGDEIVAGGSDYGGGLVVIDRSTGLPSYGPFDAEATSFDLAQLDGDVLREVVVAHHYGEISEINVLTGVLGPTLADFGDRVQALRVADVTRDGAPDLLAIVDGYLHVYDLEADTEVWLSPFLGESAGWSDSLFVRDYEQDGIPEILVNTGVGFVVFDVPLIEIFSDGFESGDDAAWG